MKDGETHIIILSGTGGMKITDSNDKHRSRLWMHNYMAYHISIADIGKIYRDYLNIDPYNLGRIRHDDSNIKQYALRSEVWQVCWTNPVLNLCVRFDKRRDVYIEEQEIIARIIMKLFLMN